MKNVTKILIVLMFWGLCLKADDYVVKAVNDDLKKPDVFANYWNGVPEASVSLMAQMITKPQPDKAETPVVKVQVLHDGKYIAFRLRWADKEISEAGKLGEFSDAIALEFPVKDNANPPPIFMGMKDNPVHLFHWRAQYQYDEVHGKKTMKDLYPNMSVDMYPLEFKDAGSVKGITQEKQEVFNPAVAEGNPQSYQKHAVDEVMAEGFGTSAVRADTDSFGHGEWKDGEWTVVITRAIKRPEGSVLEVGKGSSFGLAVWQGGADEIGSRKSVTMMWTPFKLEAK